MPAGRARHGERLGEGARPRDRRGVPAGGFDDDGRPTNLDEAVGEIVETAADVGLRGLLPQRGGHRASASATAAYWSGDLAYRDADGWLYFAGRSNEWLRVDGENFAAAPVEAIIARHPDVRSRRRLRRARRSRRRPRHGRARAARAAPTFDPAAFDAFLAEQPDLGPKWVPGVRAGRRRASEAVEPEDRQAAPPPRGVARRAGVLAAREGRAAAAARRRRPVPAGSAPARPVRVVVFGATGVIGRGALEHFSQLPECDVIGVSRRARSTSRASRTYRSTCSTEPRVRRAAAAPWPA